MNSRSISPRPARGMTVFQDDDVFGEASKSLIERGRKEGRDSPGVWGVFSGEVEPFQTVFSTPPYSPAAFGSDKGRTRTISDATRTGVPVRSIQTDNRSLELLYDMQVPSPPTTPFLESFNTPPPQLRRVSPDEFLTPPSPEMNTFGPDSSADHNNQISGVNQSDITRPHDNLTAILQNENAQLRDRLRRSTEDSNRTLRALSVPQERETVRYNLPTSSSDIIVPVYDNDITNAIKALQQENSRLRELVRSEVNSGMEFPTPVSTSGRDLLEYFQNQNNLLREYLQQANARNDSTDMKRDSMVRENARLHEELYLSREVVARVTNEKETLELEADNLRSQLEELENNHNNLQRENEDLREKVETLYKSEETSADRVETLQSRNAALTERITSLEDLVRKSDVHNIRQRLQDYESRRQEELSNLQSLTAALEESNTAARLYSWRVVSCVSLLCRKSNELLYSRFYFNWQKALILMKFRQLNIRKDSWKMQSSRYRYSLSSAVGKIARTYRTERARTAFQILLKNTSRQFLSQSDMLRMSSRLNQARDHAMHLEEMQKHNLLRGVFFRKWQTNIALRKNIVHRPSAKLSPTAAKTFVVFLRTSIYAAIRQAYFFKLRKFLILKKRFAKRSGGSQVKMKLLSALQTSSDVFLRFKYFILWERFRLKKRSFDKKHMLVAKQQLISIAAKNSDKVLLGSYFHSWLNYAKDKQSVHNSRILHITQIRFLEAAKNASDRFLLFVYFKKLLRKALNLKSNLVIKSDLSKGTSRKQTLRTLQSHLGKYALNSSVNNVILGLTFSKWIVFTSLKRRLRTAAKAKARQALAAVAAQNGSRIAQLSVCFEKLRVFARLRRLMKSSVGAHARSRFLFIAEKSSYIILRSAYYHKWLYWIRSRQSSLIRNTTDPRQVMSSKLRRQNQISALTRFYFRLQQIVFRRRELLVKTAVMNTLISVNRSRLAGTHFRKLLIWPIHKYTNTLSEAYSSSQRRNRAVFQISRIQIANQLQTGTSRMSISRSFLKWMRFLLLVRREKLDLSIQIERQKQQLLLHSRRSQVVNQLYRSTCSTIAARFYKKWSQHLRDKKMRFSGWATYVRQSLESLRTASNLVISGKYYRKWVLFHTNIGTKTFPYRRAVDLLYSSSGRILAGRYYRVLLRSALKKRHQQMRVVQLYSSTCRALASKYFYILKLFPTQKQHQRALRMTAENTTKTKLLRLRNIYHQNCGILAKRYFDRLHVRVHLSKNEMISDKLEVVEGLLQQSVNRRRRETERTLQSKVNALFRKTAVTTARRYFFQMLISCLRNKTSEARFRYQLQTSKDNTNSQIEQSYRHRQVFYQKYLTHVLCRHIVSQVGSRYFSKWMKLLLLKSIRRSLVAYQKARLGYVNQASTSSLKLLLRKYYLRWCRRGIVKKKKSRGIRVDRGLMARALKLKTEGMQRSYAYSRLYRHCLLARGTRSSALALSSQIPIKKPNARHYSVLSNALSDRYFRDLVFKRFTKLKLYVHRCKATRLAASTLLSNIGIDLLSHKKNLSESLYRRYFVDVVRTRFASLRLYTEISKAMRKAAGYLREGVGLNLRKHKQQLSQALFKKCFSDTVRSRFITLRRFSENKIATRNAVRSIQNTIGITLRTHKQYISESLYRRHFVDLTRSRFSSLRRYAENKKSVRSAAKFLMGNIGIDLSSHNQMISQSLYKRYFTDITRRRFNLLRLYSERMKTTRTAAKYLFQNIGGDLRLHNKQLSESLKIRYFKDMTRERFTTLRLYAASRKGPTRRVRDKYLAHVLYWRCYRDELKAVFNSLLLFRKVNKATRSVLPVDHITPGDPFQDDERLKKIIKNLLSKSTTETTTRRYYSSWSRFALQKRFVKNLRGSHDGVKKQFSQALSLSNNRIIIQSSFYLLQKHVQVNRSHRLMRSTLCDNLFIRFMTIRAFHIFNTLRKYAAKRRNGRSAAAVLAIRTHANCAKISFSRLQSNVIRSVRIRTGVEKLQKRSLKTHITPYYKQLKHLLRLKRRRIASQILLSQNNLKRVSVVYYLLKQNVLIQQTLRGGVMPLARKRFAQRISMLLTRSNLVRSLAVNYQRWAQFLYMMRNRRLVYQKLLIQLTRTTIKYCALDSFKKLQQHAQKKIRSSVVDKKIATRLRTAVALAATTALRVRSIAWAKWSVFVMMRSAAGEKSTSSRIRTVVALLTFSKMKTRSSAWRKWSEYVLKKTEVKQLQKQTCAMLCGRTDLHVRLSAFHKWLLHTKKNIARRNMTRSKSLSLSALHQTSKTQILSHYWNKLLFNCRIGQLKSEVSSTKYKIHIKTCLALRRSTETQVMISAWNKLNHYKKTRRSSQQSQVTAHIERLHSKMTLRKYYSNWLLWKSKSTIKNNTKHHLVEYLLRDTGLKRAASLFNRWMNNQLSKKNKRTTSILLKEKINVIAIAVYYRKWISFTAMNSLKLPLGMSPEQVKSSRGEWSQRMTRKSTFGSGFPSDSSDVPLPPVFSPIASSRVLTELMTSSTMKSSDFKSRALSQLGIKSDQLLLFRYFTTLLDHRNHRRFNQRNREMAIRCCENSSQSVRTTILSTYLLKWVIFTGIITTTDEQDKKEGLQKRSIDGLQKLIIKQHIWNRYLCWFAVTKMKLHKKVKSRLKLSKLTAVILLQKDAARKVVMRRYYQRLLIHRYEGKIAIMCREFESEAGKMEARCLRNSRSQNQTNKNPNSSFSSMGDDSLIFGKIAYSSSTLVRPTEVDSSTQLLQNLKNALSSFGEGSDVPLPPKLKSSLVAIEDELGRLRQTSQKTDSIAGSLKHVVLSEGEDQKRSQTVSGRPISPLAEQSHFGIVKVVSPVPSLEGSMSDQKATEDTHTISELRALVSALQRQLSQRRSLSPSVSVEDADRIHSLTERNTSLQRDLSTLQESSGLNSLRKDLESSKFAIQQLEEINNNNNSVIESLKQTLQEGSNDKHLAAENKHLQDKNSELTEELQNTQGSRLSQTLEMEDTLTKIPSSVLATTKLDAELLRQSARQLAASQEEQMKLHQKITLKDSTIDSLEEKLSELHDRQLDASVEMASKSKLISSLREKEQFSSNSDHIKFLEMKLSTLEGEIDVLRDENSRLQQLSGTSSNDHREVYEKEIKYLKIENNRLEQQLSEIPEIDSLRDENSRLSQKSMSLQLEVESLQQYNKNYSERLQTLRQSTFDDDPLEVIDEKAPLGDSEKLQTTQSDEPLKDYSDAQLIHHQLQQLSNQNNKLTEELNKVQSDNHSHVELENENINLKRVISNLRVSLENTSRLAEENNNLKKEIMKQGGEPDDNKIVILRDDIKQLQSQLSHREELLSRREDELSKLQIIIKSLETTSAVGEELYSAHPAIGNLLKQSISAVATIKNYCQVQSPPAKPIAAETPDKQELHSLELSDLISTMKSDLLKMEDDPISTLGAENTSLKSALKGTVTRTEFESLQRKYFKQRQLLEDLQKMMEGGSDLMELMNYISNYSFNQNNNQMEQLPLARTTTNSEMLAENLESQPEDVWLAEVERLVRRNQIMESELRRSYTRDVSPKRTRRVAAKSEVRPVDSRAEYIVLELPSDERLSYLQELLIKIESLQNNLNKSYQEQSSPRRSPRREPSFEQTPQSPLGPPSSQAERIEKLPTPERLEAVRKLLRKETILEREAERVQKIEPSLTMDISFSEAERLQEMNSDKRREALQQLLEDNRTLEVELQRSYFREMSPRKDLENVEDEVNRIQVMNSKDRLDHIQFLFSRGSILQTELTNVNKNKSTNTNAEEIADLPTEECISSIRKLLKRISELENQSQNEQPDQSTPAKTFTMDISDMSTPTGDTSVVDDGRDPLVQVSELKRKVSILQSEIIKADDVHKNISIVQNELFAIKELVGKVSSEIDNNQTTDSEKVDRIKQLIQSNSTNQPNVNKEVLHTTSQSDQIYKTTSHLDTLLREALHITESYSVGETAVDDSDNDLIQKLKLKTNQITELHAIVTGLNAKAQDDMTVISSLEERLSKNETHNDFERIETLERELERKTRQQSELSEVLNELQQLHEKDLIRIEELSTTSSDNSRLSQELLHKTSQLENLRLIVSELNETHNNTKHPDIQTLTNDNKILSEKLSTETANVTKLQQQVEDTRCVIEDNNELHKKQFSDNKHLTDEVSRLNSEMETLRSDAARGDEMKETINELQATRVYDQARLQELKEKLQNSDSEKLNADLTRKTRQLHEMKDVMQGLQIERDADQVRVKELEDKMKNNDSEKLNNDLNRKTRQLDELRSIVEELKDAHQHEQDRVRDLELKLTSQTDFLQQQLSNKTIEVNELNSSLQQSKEQQHSDTEIETLQSDLQTLTNQHKDLKTVLISKQELIETLKDDIEHYKTLSVLKKKTTSDSTSVQYSELKSELDNKNSALEELRPLISNLRSERDVIQNELDTTRKRFREAQKSAAGKVQIEIEKKALEERLEGLEKGYSELQSFVIMKSSDRSPQQQTSPASHTETDSEVDDQEDMYLGLEVADTLHIDGPNHSRASIKYEGVRVVSSRRPAAPAVRPGDVIISVCGMRTLELSEFRNAIRKCSIDSSIVLIVRRLVSGEMRETNVEIRPRTRISTDDKIKGSRGINNVLLYDRFGLGSGASVPASSGTGLVVRDASRPPTPTSVRGRSSHSPDRRVLPIRINPLTVFTTPTSPVRNDRSLSPTMSTPYRRSASSVSRTFSLSSSPPRGRPLTTSPRRGRPSTASPPHGRKLSTSPKRV